MQVRQARKPFLLRRVSMKAQYDISRLKPRKNPNASKLIKTVTMRLSKDVIQYFQSMAEDKQ
jgi:hypothetical protein